MSEYYVGDTLRFHTKVGIYNIREGDVAIIKGQRGTNMWCVCFDHDVHGHSCDIPHLIRSGYGWFLGGSELDAVATVISTPDEIDISNTELEDVL